MSKRGAGKANEQIIRQESLQGRSILSEPLCPFIRLNASPLRELM